MVGGSFVVLVHVAVAIFLTFKRPLLIMNNRDSMLKYLSKVRHYFELNTEGLKYKIKLVKFCHISMLSKSLS